MQDRPNLLSRLAWAMAPDWAARREENRQHAATYRGAAQTRLDSGWTMLPNGNARQVNTANGPSYSQMRARARQLELDNVLAGAVLDRAVENVIGGGMRIQPMSSSPEFNAACTASWKAWTKGTRADVRHMHTFGALQQLAYRCKIRDGDGGVLLTEELDRAGRSHPRLQVIEGEHIATPIGGMKAEDGTELTIIDGVELGPNDEATGFYLAPRTLNAKPIRVRSRDFVYLCRPALYSSVRGESALNGSWTLFDQIVGYLESVVVASRVAASQALVIMKNNPAATMNALAPLGGNQAAGSPTKSFSVQPGMAHVLAPGESIGGFNPTQPQQQMESAINTFCRFVGLRFGLTIEQVLLNFSLTTYSSGRAARLQAEATAQKEQEDFAATFLARVYPWAVSKWIKSGMIDVAAPDDGTAYDFEWIPQARPWLDPAKELDAAERAIALNLDARSLIAMGQGYKFDDLIKANKEDKAKLIAAGLMDAPQAPAAPLAVVVNASNLDPATESEILANPPPNIDEAVAAANGYGVAVRAGAITPQTRDEEYFRSKFALPPMSEPVATSWEDEGGVRRPITLAKAEIVSTDPNAPVDPAANG